MWGFLKRLFSQPPSATALPPRSSGITRNDGTPVSQTPEGKLFAIIAHNHCPHCDRDTQWLAGPEGGLSQNIKCEECNWCFNVNPIGIAQDIGFNTFGRTH